jgi:hypothetical protein
VGFDGRVKMPTVRTAVQQAGSILTLFSMLFKRVVVADASCVIVPTQSGVINFGLEGIDQFVEFG